MALATASVSETATSIIFSWTPAVMNSPLPITYIVDVAVTNSTSNSTSWREVTRNLLDSTLTLSNLPLGNNYTYRVRTNNVVGDSTPAYVAVLAAAVPSSPTTLPQLLEVGLYHGYASLFVAVNPIPQRQARGSPVLYYRIAATHGNNQTLQIDVPTANLTINQTVEVKGLTAGSAAAVKYAACNAIGCGDFSVATVRMVTALSPKPNSPLATITALNGTSATIVVEYTELPTYPDAGLTLYYLMQYSTSARSSWVSLSMFEPNNITVPGYSLTYLFQIFFLNNL